jgi:mono/diheme cytochrome c family protein
LPREKNVAAEKSTPNKKLIERGKYLVTLAGCDDCHTPKKMGPQGPVLDESKLLSGQPAHEPIAEVPKEALAPGKWMAVTSMHLSAWAGPWGISFARNLTPDVETGLGSWTEEMFIKTLRLGKHMGEGRPILPPMPWESFAKMTDADLKAIFAYLKSLPPIANAVPDPISPTGEAVPTPAKKP